ncbi:MAG: DUF1611 domain-containing protein [Acidobacteriota bacterium]
MAHFPDGNAIVYCEGAYDTPIGKTAHGLVRRTARYRILSVVDSHLAGRDAGEALDGRFRGIPVCADLSEAIARADEAGRPASRLVIGLAPDGGRLSPAARRDVLSALESGLHVDSGLHDFLSEDAQIAALAERKGVTIRDVRKPPARSRLHFFSGKIEQVQSLKVALLGTDSGVGKRTTAWLLVDGLSQSGFGAELIGTGQTAWMQGARYSLILDSLVNDFVSGEIEHAVWSAWNDLNPEVIVIEGQGSLMNPAYPGGFEILAAGRPDIVILQHAPARREYDGFPGYPLHPLSSQIQAVELLSGKPVAALTINHEGLSRDELSAACQEAEKETGLPAFDVLEEGVEELVELVSDWITRKHGAVLA